MNNMYFINCIHLSLHPWYYYIYCRKIILFTKHEFQGKPPYPPLRIFTGVSKLVSSYSYEHQRNFELSLYSYSDILLVLYI